MPARSFWREERETGKDDMTRCTSSVVNNNINKNKSKNTTTTWLTVACIDRKSVSLHSTVLAGLYQIRILLSGPSFHLMGHSYNWAPDNVKQEVLTWRLTAVNLIFLCLKTVMYCLMWLGLQTWFKERGPSTIDSQICLKQIGFWEHLLLWKRAQQKAPNVPMRTTRARKAPTATPMMTAKRRDSEKTWRSCFIPSYEYQQTVMKQLWGLCLAAN